MWSLFTKSSGTSDALCDDMFLMVLWLLPFRDNFPLTGHSSRRLLYTEGPIVIDAGNLLGLLKPLLINLQELASTGWADVGIQHEWVSLAKPCRKTLRGNLASPLNGVLRFRWGDPQDMLKNPHQPNVVAPSTCTGKTLQRLDVGKDVDMIPRQESAEPFIPALPHDTPSKPTSLR